MILFNRRKAFRGFVDPNSIAGLQLWMDGEDGLTTDLSDNAHSVTNTGVTISTADLNGLDTFRYNGSAHQSLGTLLGKPANYTISAVVKADDAATRQTAFASFNSGGEGITSWGVLILSQTAKPSKSVYTSFGNGTVFRDSTTPIDTFVNGTYHLVTLRYTSGDGFTEVFVDGVLQTTIETGTSTSCAGTAFEFALGRAGAVPSVIQLTGNIASLTQYDQSISNADKAALENYYTTRYAL